MLGGRVSVTVQTEEATSSRFKLLPVSVLIRGVGISLRVIESKLLFGVIVSLNSKSRDAIITGSNLDIDKSIAAILHLVREALMREVISGRVTLGVASSLQLTVSIKGLHDLLKRVVVIEGHRSDRLRKLISDVPGAFGLLTEIVVGANLAVDGADGSVEG